MTKLAVSRTQLEGLELEVSLCIMAMFGYYSKDKGPIW